MIRRVNKLIVGFITHIKNTTHTWAKLRQLHAYLGPAGIHARCSHCEQFMQYMTSTSVKFKTPCTYYDEVICGNCRKVHLFLNGEFSSIPHPVDMACFYIPRSTGVPDSKAIKSRIDEWATLKNSTTA